MLNSCSLVCNVYIATFPDSKYSLYDPFSNTAFSLSVSLVKCGYPVVVFIISVSAISVEFFFAIMSVCNCSKSISRCFRVCFDFTKISILSNCNKSNGFPPGFNNLVKKSLCSSISLPFESIIVGSPSVFGILTVYCDLSFVSVTVHLIPDVVSFTRSSALELSDKAYKAANFNNLKSCSRTMSRSRSRSRSSILPPSCSIFIFNLRLLYLLERLEVLFFFLVRICPPAVKFSTDIYIIVI